MARYLHHVLYRLMAPSHNSPHKVSQNIPVFVLPCKYGPVHYILVHIGLQLRFRRACAFVQARQTLCCSYTESMEVDNTKSMEVDEGSGKNIALVFKGDFYSNMMSSRISFAGVFFILVCADFNE